MTKTVKGPGGTRVRKAAQDHEEMVEYVYKGKTVSVPGGLLIRNPEGPPGRRIALHRAIAIHSNLVDAKRTTRANGWLANIQYAIGTWLEEKEKADAEAR